MLLKSGYFLVIVYLFTVVLYGGILIVRTSRPSKLLITIFLGFCFIYRVVSVYLAIYISYGVPCFKVVRRKFISSVYSRILSSKNCLVDAIVNSSHFMHGGIFKQWIKVLF